MATSTSLNLQAVFKTAAARGGLDTAARIVSGLSPAAKAFYVAAAAQGRPRDVVVLVTPTDRDIDQAVSDVAFFLAALEGLSESAASRAVLPFPSHEVDPYRGLTPHFGVLCARARALQALAKGTGRVLVASAAALQPHAHVAELDAKSQQHGMLAGTPVTRGMTFGIADLLAAKEIVMLVTGSGKREIVRQFLQEEISTDCPASLFHLHANVRVFLDEESVPG